jgi:hypothetical protein
MAAKLDVYREWLKIPDADRPLSHYQLLRLTKFEDDVAKIRGNYRKMNAHVRKFAAGEYQQQSQDLLNELAKAMLCLTDARRKSEYDAGLGRTTAAGERRTLEQILIAGKLADSDQLAKARNYAAAVGIDLHEALVQQKLAADDVVMQAYAESIGLPYVDLEETGVDAAVAPRVPAVLARQHSLVPVLVDDNQVLLASPNPIAPDVEEELRLRLGMGVRSVLCTVSKLNQAIEKHYSKEAAQRELASGKAGPVKAGQPVAAAPATAAAARPALTPEERAAAKKRRLGKAIVAFNFVGMPVMVAMYYFVTRPPAFFMSLGAALLAGGLAAAGAYLMSRD